MIDNADMSQLREMFRDIVRAEVAPISAALSATCPARLERIEALETRQEDHATKIAAIKDAQAFRSGQERAISAIIALVVSFVVAVVAAAASIYHTSGPK